MKVHYNGEYRDAVFVADESGKYRGQLYFDSLADRDKAKFIALIQHHCDSKLGVRDREKVRLEGEHVWVFKIFKRRLHFYVEGRTLFITHGCDKKRDKADPKQFEITRRIRNYHLS